jgi:hypothetical protein
MKIHTASLTLFSATAVKAALRTTTLKNNGVDCTGNKQCKSNCCVSMSTRKHVCAAKSDDKVCIANLRNVGGKPCVTSFN